MNQEKINNIVNLFLESFNMQDPMSARAPLHEAENISKSMSKEDFKEAIRQVTITFLNQDKADFAMAVLEDLGLFTELRQDEKVKIAADKAYKIAQQNQLEVAERIKDFFKLG